MDDVSLGLSCAATNLWEQEINAERGILVVQEALELCNLLSQHVWSVADTTNNTNTARVGDCGGELGTSGDVHTGEHHGVVDLEQIGRHRAELLCIPSC